MTDDTLKIILALGVPAASAVGAYAARGLVSFGKHLFNEAIDARIQIRAAKADRKRDARAIRELRMADERHRHGRVSIAPPADEDDTGVYEAMRSEDLRWLEEQRQYHQDPHRAWGANPHPEKQWNITESTPPNLKPSRHGRK